MKNKIEFKNILKFEANKIGIELNEEQLEKFYIYKNLLLEWNQKMNLTAITDDYQIIMKHFVDCLEIVKYIPNNISLIDVGTGAGFPGIVIAIFFNGDIKITLVDALAKRVSFLEEVISKLGLSNIIVIHARAEELSRENIYREKYDMVVSRAVANLNMLLEFDIPLLKVGGIALLLKSNSLENEICNSNNALKLLNCKIEKIIDYSYTVDNEIFSRKILSIKKEKTTNIKYPRNYGKIKKEPL